MKSRADIHRRMQRLYWLGIACMVGLSGLGSCQHPERALASSNGNGTRIEASEMMVETPFE
jgi:hypothetical protein